MLFAFIFPLIFLFVGEKAQTWMLITSGGLVGVFFIVYALTGFIMMIMNKDHTKSGLELLGFIIFIFAGWAGIMIMRGVISLYINPNRPWF